VISHSDSKDKCELSKNILQLLGGIYMHTEPLTSVISTQQIIGSPPYCLKKKHPTVVLCTTLRNMKGIFRPTRVSNTKYEKLKNDSRL
jgi:hypothetical protein